MMKEKEQENMIISVKKHDDKVLNRRNVLAALGTTGFALLAGMSKAEVFNKENSIDIQVFKSVKALKTDKQLKMGMLVTTLGYYVPSDGGGNSYIIDNISAYPDVDEGSVIKIHSGLVAVLVGAEYVNYKMFGSKSDSTHDDGVNIKAAHGFANRNGIPVINVAGEYWIKETNGIEILTSVDWGQSIFHIDEQFNVKNRYRFSIKSAKKSFAVTLEAGKKNSLLKRLEPGVQIIPELSQYKNSLVFISNRNKKIGYRYGAKYKGQSHTKEDFFYIEEGGRIIGEVAWDFTDYTHILVYPCDSNYLTIEGGSFYLSGNNPGEKYDGYWRNGFAISRSRVVIRNQWVGLEPQKEDISLTPRTGFYSLSRVYDVTMENVRLIPWIQDRIGEDRDVKAGTYGISCGRTLQTNFLNVTAEGGKGYWGVFGSNLNKMFRIERCNLNRVDVHFYCWNLQIQDSYIGYGGITVTGGGNLTVENTTVWSAHYFISFRRDFGSTWNGNIYINNCRHIIAGDNEIGILRFFPANFDYHYPIYFGRNINVQNFVVDFESEKSNDSTYWMMKIPGYSQMKGGGRIGFPNNITFKNVNIHKRKKGVRLMHIEDPYGYNLYFSGGFDGDMLRSNCQMTFEDIHLEKISEAGADTDSHFLYNTQSDRDYSNEDALFPTIMVRNCANIIAVVNGAINLTVDHCIINQIKAGQNQALMGEVNFINCKLQPVVVDIQKAFYILSALSGVSFINCLFLSPILNEVQKPKLINNSGIVALNEMVRHNHLNSRLSNSILNYCASNSISLDKRFMNMMKNHSDFDSETF